MAVVGQDVVADAQEVALADVGQDVVLHAQADVVGALEHVVEPVLVIVQILVLRLANGVVGLLVLMTVKAHVLVVILVV